MTADDVTSPKHGEGLQNQTAVPADHQAEGATCCQSIDFSSVMLHGTDHPDWHPTVVCFACTYCAYTAADLAGAMRLSYPAAVKIVQIPCTGRVDINLLLDAFEHGADAVFVAGCNIGDCHFREGNIHAKEEVARCRRLLEEIGLEPDRLEFFHVPASAANLFAQVASTMTDRAKRLGPNPLRQSVGQDFGRKLAVEGPLPPAIPSQEFGRLKSAE